VDQGLRELEKRIAAIENRKYPTQMRTRASATYSQADMNAIIDKLNELLRMLDA
jgi:hypothetical protein